MKIRTFLYLIKQGVASTFRNKWFTLASVATIAACLFLFGIGFSVFYNLEHMVRSAEEGVSVTVFFNEGTTEERMKEIETIIAERDEVRETNFVSADEAWESFRGDYFEGYNDGFTENPLANSANIEIYLSDVSLQSALVTYLESIPDVRMVRRSEVTATTLTGVNVLIGYVSIGIIGILLAVSIFLISNTVTIGISVRKEEISIMKYVGATDFFVRSPFVIEGMLIGLIGAGIPLGIIKFLYEYLIAYIAERFVAISGLLNFLTTQEIFKDLVPISLGIGVGIGFLGSITTVRKHLRV